MTGFLTLNANPVNGLHAVTKQYADAIAIASHAVGFYTGNNTNPRTIALPFTPAAIIVFINNPGNGVQLVSSDTAMAVTGNPSGGVGPALAVAVNGFTLNNADINNSARTYNYIAFK